jgi:chromatin remodeling complex protein RSC6
MPSKTKAPKNKVKAKKVSKKVEAVVEPVVEPVAPVAPVAPVEPVAPESTLVAPSDDFDYSSEITELQTSLKDALALIKGLVTHVNKLEKRLGRDKRILEKKLKTKPRRASNGLNGFSKPGPVSDELRAFLKLGKEDLIARTEVTKKITVYCQENGLQKESDKRIILADKALTKLLSVPKGEDLTYFNLQKYMKVHFPNKDGVYPTL